jgi:hypothetical protein
MLALGPVGQTHRQRVILAPRRPRQNRRVQVAVVVSYAKTCSNRRDRRRCDQEKQKADKSLAEPSHEQTCARILRMHRRRQGPSRLTISDRDIGHYPVHGE